MLKVLPIVLYREVKPFPIWFYLLLLDNDVFLHILVVLVVVISTSPRTSKTDFVRKTCCVFGVGGFTDCSLKRGKILPHLVLSSIVVQGCFSAYSCSARCGDSNEPKNIENGVRMQKLWQFSFCCFCCLGGIGYSGSSLNRNIRLAPECPAPKSLAVFWPPEKLGRKFRFKFEPEYPVFNGSISWGHINGPLLPQRP